MVKGELNMKLLCQAYKHIIITFTKTIQNYYTTEFQKYHDFYNDNKLSCCYLLIKSISSKSFIT